MTALPRSTPRIRMPSGVRAGEAFEIRTLIDHPMETGLPRPDGEARPRRMIARFEALADGDVMFAADLRNGTAANPYLVFMARLERTTTITFLWREEDGREYRTTQRVTVM